MNKTVNQSLHFHVDRQKSGWVCALPQICFTIMNTVNASTGFSKFQLHLGLSPHVIPPLVPDLLPQDLCSAAAQVEDVINWIALDVGEAQDNLLAVKAFQAHYVNISHGCKIVYNVGSHVMLSTFHRCQEYRKKGDKQATKFFPQWDGLYMVTQAHSQTSNYTLDMNRHDSIYPTYHASKLKQHIPNNPNLFPNCDHPHLGPQCTHC